jgi:hypothetical protein
MAYYLIHYLGLTGGQRPFYSCIKLGFMKMKSDDHDERADTHSSGWIFSDKIENYDKYDPDENDLHRSIKAVFA